MRNNKPAIIYMLSEMAVTRKEQLDINRLGFEPRLRNAQFVDNVEACAGVIYASDKVKALVLKKAPGYKRIRDGRLVWAEFIKEQEAAFEAMGEDDFEDEPEQSEETDEGEEAEEVDLSKMSKKELLAYAKEHDVELDPGLTNKAMVAILLEPREDGWAPGED